MNLDSKRIILIDDDPVYLKVMKVFSEMNNISLDAFSSLDELGFIGKLSSYDVAIIDYDLGVVDGEDIATYADALMPDIPIIIVSGSRRRPRCTQWPKSVKGFVLKDEGYTAPYLKASEIFESVA